MARPRKTGDRQPSGRLKRKGGDPRWETAKVRVRRFGVTPSMALSQHAGHLAGVMFLRGMLNATDLGRFHAFVQLVPVASKAIVYGVRTSGGVSEGARRVSTQYHRIIALLGPAIAHLHDLNEDRLTCDVRTLKRLLRRVPLTPGAQAFIRTAETDNPPSRPEPIRRSRDVVA